jgi:hypothetical protein
VQMAFAGTSQAFRLVFWPNVGIGSRGIVYGGTEAHKRVYLPRLASGEMRAGEFFDASSSGHASGARNHNEFGVEQLDVPIGEELEKLMAFKSPKEAVQQLLATPGVPAPIDTNLMAKTLGAVLQAAAPEGGSLEVRFTPDECFVQGAGVLQGGMVSAMLDFAMVFAGFGVTPKGRSFRL